MRICVRLGAAMAAIAIFVCAPHAAAQSRYAAVIGVDAYSEELSPHVGAVADARAVAEAFAAVGFEVELVEDPRQGDIRRAAFWLSDQLGRADDDALGVFYFAGHVAQTDGLTFLLGTDARAGDALEIVETGVPASYIVSQLDSAENTPNFIVLDITAPSEAAQRLGLPRGSGAFDTPDGGMIILSDYPGHAPPPRAQVSSIFTQAFIDFINDERSGLARRLETLRVRVYEDTDRLRRVWMAGSIEADGFRLAAPEPEEDEANGEPASAVITLRDTERETTAEPATGARFHDAEIFFATDREPVFANADFTLSDSQADQLSFGAARVLVAPGLTRGDLEPPAWWEFENLDGDDARPGLRALDLRDQDAFFANVRGIVQRTDERAAFVYVHGFATPPEEAVIRTARLHHELGFDGAPIAFIWPSQGEASALGYDRDAVAVDRAAARLERFLEFVVERTGAERVHVIAHALGARAALRATINVAERRGVRAFGEVILAAPDIDAAQLASLAQGAAAAAERITIYGSVTDPSITEARRYAGDVRRASELSGADGSLDDLELPEAFEFIEASDVRTDIFSAGDTGPFASIIEDMGELLATHAPPSERSRTILIERETLEGRTYWSMAPMPDTP